MMAPKSDKKFSEVFDALGKVNQFTQNNRDSILGAALGTPTAGLPVPQIKGAIENTIGGIQAAGNFANNNPQIQGLLDNEYLQVAAGLNPVTGAAATFGNLSRLAGNFNPSSSPKNSRPKASGTVINIDGKSYDTGFHSKEIAELRKKTPGGGNAGQSTTTYTPPVTGGLDTGSGNRDAKLDPNATERYAANFKAGQANMSDIQEMYADRKDLQEWAKANPALAQKEFAKSGFQSTRMKNADIQDQMDDTGRSRDDIIAINNGGLETVIDGSSIGNSTPQDAQAFKNAAAQLVAKGQLPSSMNAGSTPIITGVTPMIEGIELSTAVKPDYKAEMEDGVMNQLAKGLDSPTKRFASQNLKDLFMNNMLGK